jgi:hypothetical protein
MAINRANSFLPNVTNIPCVLLVDDVLAGNLLSWCKELEPQNPHCSRELGSLYSIQADPRQRGRYKDWAVKVQRWYGNIDDEDKRFRCGAAAAS